MGEVSLNLGEILFVPVLVDDLGQWKWLLHLGDDRGITLVLGVGDQGLEHRGGLQHLDGAMLLGDLRGDGLRKKGRTASSCYGGMVQERGLVVVLQGFLVPICSQKVGYVQVCGAEVEN